MAEEKERVWYPLKRHQFNVDNVADRTDEDDGEDISLSGLEDKVKVLRKLSPGEYVVVNVVPNGDTGPNIDLSDTEYFQNYVEALRRMGIDIGKGDAGYGYKMPVPKHGAKIRELIVFRRR